MAFFLKKMISAVLLPPLLPMIVMVSGLLMASRKKKGGWWVAWTGMALALFFSMPLTMNFLVRGLESIPPIQAKQLEQAQAIVILGGGHRDLSPEFGSVMPGSQTLERLCYGAFLARRTGLPVLVSGGAPRGGPSEASVMAHTLKTHFGVTAAWIEERSLDTGDNARYSAAILEKAGIGSIALVTHATHMRRSVYEFSRTGLQVLPAPTAFFSSDMKRERFFGLVPDVKSVQIGYYVTHEWLGILAQRIRDFF